MFRFGRSSTERAAINSFVLQLEQIGLPTNTATKFATNLVDEVLDALRPRGVDPFKTTQGNEYALREDYTTPRLAAGLTIDDIRMHWNRPILIVLGEVKMREMFNFVMIDVARQQGKDLIEAGNNYKRTFPRYGNPANWDPTDKFNIGLEEKDADIYPEFATRVDAWNRRTQESEKLELIERHGTLNAVIRSLVKTGKL